MRRRYTPPPRYEEVVPTLEPAPFADLFSEVEDFVVEVRPFSLENSALDLACMPGQSAVRWQLLGNEGCTEHAQAWRIVCVGVRAS